MEKIFKGCIFGLVVMVLTYVVWCLTYGLSVSWTTFERVSSACDNLGGLLILLGFLSGGVCVVRKEA